MSSNVIRMPRPMLRALPEPSAGERAAIGGASFEAWVEANRDRIWRLLMVGDLRETTFDQLARRIWSAI